MEDKLLEKIQKRVVDLLHTLSNDLHVAAKGQCSEVARLAGCWILTEHSGYTINILKGEFSDKSAHDILGVMDGKTVFLIDPTIWQIFPESKSIFIASPQDIPEAINLLTNKYSGSWKISETIKQCNEHYQQGLLTTTKSNREEI